MVNVIEDRDKYIGGSDMPVILGISKYEKDILYFAMKKAGIIPDFFIGNSYTKYGQYMEPKIREYINKKYNAEYKESTKIRDYLRGNCDGIDKEAEIPLIEIKTHGEAGLDTEYYTPQCQFYMEVFDVDKCMLVGYERPEDFYTGDTIDYNEEDFNLEFNPEKLSFEIIERDKTKWNRYLIRIKIFYNLLSDLRVGILPEIALTMYEEAIDEINKRDTEGIEILDENKNKITLEQFNNLHKEYLKAEEFIKRYKALQGKMYEQMAENELQSIETKEFKITVIEPSQYTKTEINKEKLEKEYKEIYEEVSSLKVIDRKGYLKITERGKDGRRKNR